MHHRRYVISARQWAAGATLVAAFCGVFGVACRSESSTNRGVETSADVPATKSADRTAADTGAPADDWRALYDVWVYPAPIPDFELTDQTGAALRLSALADGYVLIGFVYTRCPLPEACPLTTEKMRQVQARWRAVSERGESAGKRLYLLSLTLDPDFDTPERLARFARDRDLDTSNWHLATGPHELMESALPSLFSVLALPRAPGDIQHTVKAALLAPGLRIAKEWPDNAFSAADVIAEVLR